MSITSQAQGTAVCLKVLRLLLALAIMVVSADPYFMRDVRNIYALLSIHCLLVYSKAHLIRWLHSQGVLANA